MINRALIVKKEHLDNIFDGIKPWEMRSRATNVRGRIGLIESGSGLIVGEVDLTDCLRALNSDVEKLITQHLHQVEDIKLLDKWRFPWVLENPERYEIPKPYKHPQGAVIWVKI